MNHETYMELYRKIIQWNGVLKMALENLQGEVTEDGQAAIDALDLVYVSVSDTLRTLDRTPITKGGFTNGPDQSA